MNVADLIYEKLFKKYNGELKSEYDLFIGSALSYKGVGYDKDSVAFLKDIMNVVQAINSMDRSLKIEIKIMVNVEEVEENE